MGRTSLAIAPSNPDVMYALAASNVPGPQGIYRTGPARRLSQRQRRHRRLVADARQQLRPDVPQHDAAHQHGQRRWTRLQSAAPPGDAVHHGLVQQRDRGRSARSRTRLGRGRRLVPIGRRRAQLGTGELQQQHAAVACARRSARHHVPSAVQRRQQPDRVDWQRRRHLSHQQRARRDLERTARAAALGGGTDPGQLDVAQSRLRRDAVLSRRRVQRRHVAISPARRTTARSWAPTRPGRTAGASSSAATAASAPCIRPTRIRG